MTGRPTADQIMAALDAKAKPPGALGGLERLAARVAAVQGTLAPRLERCRLTIFAGDHGIVAQGVSAWPQAVTGAMVRAFLSGGAAACVLARSRRGGGAGGGCRHREPVDDPRLILRRMGAGTADSARRPGDAGGGGAGGGGGGAGAGGGRRRGRGGVRGDGDRQHLGRGAGGGTS
jgi:nicotinate-nucleotide--dimethylbenzimidazole phosphoribosyltransferase